MGAKEEDGRIVFTSERDFEHHMLASAAAHHAVGLEDFAGRLEKKAGAAFVAGRDNDAALLRDLAREAKEIARSKRGEQAKWAAETAKEG